MKKASLWHDGQKDVVRFYKWMLTHNIQDMIDVETGDENTHFILELKFKDEKVYTLFLLNFKRTKTRYRPKRFVFMDCDE